MILALTDIGNIVSHDDVREGEVGSGSVGQVADDEPVWHATVLVHHQEVGDVVGPAGVHQLAELVAATVESLRPGEDQPHLLKGIGKGKYYIDSESDTVLSNNSQMICSLKI